MNGWNSTSAPVVVLLLLILVMPESPLSAREYAPRVLSKHNADAYSMKTFALYERWKDLEGDAKAWEVFQYLVDKRTGLYPMGAGAWEGNDVLYEYGYIRDPVKMINVYSQGYCDMLGPTLEGILEDMGLGPARTVNIPAWSHVAAEVFYDGQWHYLDLDVRAAFRRQDGSLASVEDARKDPSLWNGPSRPWFFPLDNIERAREAYLKSPPQYRYGVNMGGHTMDYILRRGKTFTRWWKPQGDRWNHHKTYHEGLRAILEREPKGPKSKHPSFTIHTRGNGRFFYQPRLTMDSRDFEDGVYDAQNVKATAEGLTLEHPGRGYAIFEVRSPYCIVPRVGIYETTEDDREASVIQVGGEGFSLSVSVDNGLSWETVHASKEAADLTSLVAGTYGYLLKLDLKGEPENVVVRSLKITTWVQVHPASLPSLKVGKNRMRYVTDDHYGLPTRMVEIRTNGSDRKDFLKYLVETPGDYVPERKTQRVLGEAVARVKAPPDTGILWFSAGGNFSTHQGEAAPRTKNSMAYAIDEPRNFKVFYRSNIPPDQSHWHYNADVEVKLEEPAETVYIRYVGDPGLNNIRIYAHCVDEKTYSPAQVAITHGWSETGKPRSKTVTLQGPGEYEVECARDPVDEFVELSVPSDPEN